MESARQFALIVCVAVSTSQAACIASTELDGLEGEDELVEEVQQEIVVYNALTHNALTHNGLIGNPFTSEALRDPESRELLSFIVSCALPEDEKITVEVDRRSYTFVGELGLAPEWGRRNGSCGEKCQEWVSACLLSRVNYRGEHVPISLRGKNDALSSTRRERDTYEEPEATYYGNVFLKNQRRFACLAPGQRSIPRVCGPSIDDCVVDIVGKCEDVCDGPRQDGSYTDCRDRKPLLKLPCGTRIFPLGTDSYKASVSVFLE